MKHFLNIVAFLSCFALLPRCADEEVKLPHEIELPKSDELAIKMLGTWTALSFSTTAYSQDGESSGSNDPKPTNVVFGRDAAGFYSTNFPSMGRYHFRITGNEIAFYWDVSSTDADEIYRIGEISDRKIVIKRYDVTSQYSFMVTGYTLTR